jgi:L-threonylcarbamoyladenylate synthase
LTGAYLDVAEGALLLARGGIVAYPTETFYGLGALASDASALGRLVSAKLRPEGKAVPLVAADEEQVAAIALFTDPAALALARRFWPGPLTLVLPARAHADTVVTGGGPTVAIRVPGHAVARALARRAGGAIVSTSANLAGEPPVTRAADLTQALRSRIDGVVDGGDTPGGLPSTIVAIEAGTIRLLREGAIPWPDIAGVPLPRPG